MGNSLEWSDIVEIQQLLYRIAATADTAADIRDYLDLLTADVVFDFAEVPAIGLAAHRYTGHNEVRAGVVERRAAGVQGPGSNTLHIVSDVAVQSGGQGTASVHAAWQYLGLRDAVPTLISLGLYENAVRFVDGRWLLANRRVVVFS